MPRYSRPVCTAAALAAAAVFLTACASNAPSTTAGTSPPAVTTPGEAATPTAMHALTTIQRTDGWLAAPIEDGSGLDFWWRICTDAEGNQYTMIAAPLDALPSSAQGKGGIEIPARSEQSPASLMVEYCPAAKGEPESNTLNNGFMHVHVEPKSSRAEGSTGRTHWIPWPIIVRTPSHPGGAYAGVFVLLTVQEPTGAFERESIFRPNLGDQIPCDRSALPDGDSESRFVHVTGGCCGDEYQFFLREVSGVNNVKGEVSQNKVDTPSPEAAFLVDVCNFARRAREIIAATPNAKPAPVTPCKSAEH